MISTSKPPQTSEGRTLAVALVLSLLVHLLGFLFYFQSAAILKLVHLPLPHPAPSPTPEFVTTSEAITIERRAHPVPHPPPRRQVPPPQRPVAQVNPAPPPVPVPRPVQKPVVIPTLPPEPVKAELTKPTPHKTPAPTPVPSPKTVVMRPPQVQQPQTQAEPNQQRPDRLSAEQIQQMQQRFSQTIAQVRNETNPLRVPPATPAAPKRYKVQFEGHYGPLRNGEGEYWPVQHWADSGNDCYYMAYDFVYESGGYEHGNVPWPVCFAPSADPFTNAQLGKLRKTPLPPPPPGWKLPSTAQLGKALRAYFPGVSFPDS